MTIVHKSCDTQVLSLSCQANILLLVLCPLSFFSLSHFSVPDSDDYVRANQVLTFGPGGDEVQEVGVAIQDNAQLEAAEIFFGRLVTRSGGVLIAGGESAQVEVLDDDGRYSMVFYS